MSMNSIPYSERVHIGIFGRRNAGKSSIMNRILNQELAVVSDKPGTTTDPVRKAMELLPLGAAVIIDTPGLDDNGELGRLRIDKSQQVFRKIDIVLLVLDGSAEMGEMEKSFIEEVEERRLPLVIAVNKQDKLTDFEITEWEKKLQKYTVVFVSAKTSDGVENLKNSIAGCDVKSNGRRLVGDLLDEGDIVVLVVPIDGSAPKGRLILPQQQTIRDALEAGAIPVVTRDTELEKTLSLLLQRPKAVITDSQVFKTVSRIVPENIFLTSFSILMSRYKGDLQWQVEGARALDSLQDGDKILVAEGCTHHRQCEDIGSVKIPGWVDNYTGKKLEYEFTSGGSFPENIKEFSLIIHCGGCTLNDKEMGYRIQKAKENNVPVTNYGVIISYINGILQRSLEIFNK